MKAAATGRLRGKTHLMLLNRSMEGCLAEMAFNMDLLRFKHMVTEEWQFRQTEEHGG